VARVDAVGDWQLLIAGILLTKLAICELMRWIGLLDNQDLSRGKHG
jgi:hypothetical protein